jgi:hypothetical protein
LLRRFAGAGVNVRLHEAQRHSCTISNFLVRVPRLVSARPPQCGQSSGTLDVCGARATHGTAGKRLRLVLPGSCHGLSKQKYATYHADRDTHHDDHVQRHTVIARTLLVEGLRPANLKIVRHLDAFRRGRRAGSLVVRAKRRYGRVREIDVVSPARTRNVVPQSRACWMPRGNFCLLEPNVSSWVNSWHPLEFRTRAATGGATDSRKATHACLPHV